MRSSGALLVSIVLVGALEAALGVTRAALVGAWTPSEAAARAVGVVTLGAAICLVVVISRTLVRILSG
ncbi:MAG: hypothetical protein J7M39_12985 [Anaerolineae bacterium]|nr:hypothetical protein [Anaerolineae bacterium]